MTVTVVPFDGEVTLLYLIFTGSLPLVMQNGGRPHGGLDYHSANPDRDPVCYSIHPA